MGSLGENHVHTSDDGTIGVVTSLEASFVETHLSLWCLQRGDKRCGVQRQMGRDPCVLCFRGGD